MLFYINPFNEKLLASIQTLIHSFVCLIHTHTHTHYKGEEFNNKTNTPHSERAFDLVFIEQTKAIIKIIIISCTRTESKMKHNNNTNNDDKKKMEQ